MKIQLDTDKKTIKLESNVKISKLMDTLKKLLPNGEYREFTLETNTVIQYWTSPIVIHEHYPKPHWQPWYGVVTSGLNSVQSASYKALNNNLTGSLNAGGATQLKSGVFNVEV